MTPPNNMRQLLLFSLPGLTYPVIITGGGASLQGVLQRLEGLPGRIVMRRASRIGLAAVVIAAGMVASSHVLSRFFVRIRHEKTITVKGYADERMVSDVGKFSCRVTTRARGLKEGYEALSASIAHAVSSLKDRGFPKADIAVGAVSTSKVYKRDSGGAKLNEIEYYDLSQTASVASKNVNLIKTVSRGISELISEGIDIAVYTPAYYVSNLDKIKIDLLSRATADGHRRALKLAQNSGGTVGALVSARQGVFQITQPHSTATSSYGIYDTSTIDKTIKAVVTLEYAIEAGG